MNFVGAEHQQPAPKIEPICSSVRSTKDKHTCSYETRQQRSLAMRSPHLAKQFVSASRLVPFLSVTICRADASESDKTCHGASQSIPLSFSLSPLSLSLSIKRRDMFASAAPLSDMAVPKALPITASELEESRRRLYKAPLQRPANKITRRHSPRGTIWLPHILYLLSSRPRRRRFLYLCALSWPAHLLHLVKQENLLRAINHGGDRCQHFSP